MGFWRSQHQNAHQIFIFVSPSEADLAIASSTLNFYDAFLPTVKKCKLCLSLVPCVYRGFKIKFCHSSFKLFCYYGNLLRHKYVYVLFSDEWLLLINAISVIASLN